MSKEENLEDILGQNYVDEYSGSDKHIGVDEIASKLSTLVTNYIKGKMPKDYTPEGNRQTYCENSAGQKWVQQSFGIDGNQFNDMDCRL